MSNLPFGAKPGNSDPPEQVWTGRVHGTVKVHDTVIIRRHDGCLNERDAMELAQDRLVGVTRERNPGLDCEAGDDFQTEPG